MPTCAKQRPEKDIYSQQYISYTPGACSIDSSDCDLVHGSEGLTGSHALAKVAAQWQGRQQVGGVQHVSALDSTQPASGWIGTSRSVSSGWRVPRRREGEDASHLYTARLELTGLPVVRYPPLP